MCSMTFALQFPPIDPIAFHLGPIAVRWYGIAYLIGFALGYVGLRHLIRRGFLRITPETLGDLVVWLVVGVLAGGRAGWWIAYHRSTGRPEPWYEAFAAWHGGMSFHGGLLGVALAMALWSRRRKMPFWNLADGAALVAPIGLFFGRVANFINAELVGRPTTVPWGIVFPGDTVARHPSQLYEAILEGPILFVSLWLVTRRFAAHEGEIASAFLILYGMFRMLVELFRQPDEQIGFVALGWLTMGQLLSVLLVLVGITLLIWRRSITGSDTNALRKV